MSSRGRAAGAAGTAIAVLAALVPAAQGRTIGSAEKPAGASGQFCPSVGDGRTFLLQGSGASPSWTVPHDGVLTSWSIYRFGFTRRGRADRDALRGARADDDRDRGARPRHRRRSAGRLDRHADAGAADRRPRGRSARRRGRFELGLLLAGRGGSQRSVGDGGKRAYAAPARRAALASDLQRRARHAAQPRGGDRRHARHEGRGRARDGERRRRSADAAGGDGRQRRHGHRPGGRDRRGAGRAEGRRRLRGRRQLHGRRAAGELCGPRARRGRQRAGRGARDPARRDALRDAVRRLPAPFLEAAPSDNSSVSSLQVAAAPSAAGAGGGGGGVPLRPRRSPSRRDASCRHSRARRSASPDRC